MGKPTYLRASVEDWTNNLISTERLCEIWRLPFFTGYDAIRGEAEATGKWRDIPADRIEEILRKCSE